MAIYADSNFIVRIYVESDWLERTLEVTGSLAEADERIPVTWLHRTEVRNAFQLLVFTSASGLGTRITLEAAAASQARFREDLEDREGLLRTVGIDAGDWESTAEELVLRYSASRGFRTYDVLHVAAAIRLGADTFYSFDRRCNELAALAGFATPLVS